MDQPPFQNHCHHNSRYVDVLHLPNYSPPPFHQRHVPPPAPPPPRPPHHILPPIRLHHIPHNPLPPPPPGHFTLSHPHPRRPSFIEEKSQRYEFDRPCSPLTPPPLHLLLPLGGRTELRPPPPSPIARENFHFRHIDNCQERNPMFGDEFFIDNIRSGYRDNYNDAPSIWDRGFPQDGRKINDLDFDREDNARDHKRFGSRSERDFNTEPLMGHESYSERDGDGDGRRWDYNANDRNSFHLQNQESATGDHSLARFRGRLGRGGRVQEFIRSPMKKQEQKKSALLRIQFRKSSNRNIGAHEHHHQLKEPSSISFRGEEKEGLLLSQRKTEEERERERERSSVELGVSFKSNALVAKAIVASSRPAVESDRNLTPRNRNIRKATIMPGSTSIKLSAISRRESDFQDDPDKAPKVSEEKVAISRSESSNVINANCLGENAADKGPMETIDSNQSGNSAWSDRAPIHRLRKNRKLNMQIASESSPQLTKDSVEIIHEHTSSNNPSAFSLLDGNTTMSEGNTASACFDTVPDIVLPSSSNEVNISKAEEKLECMVSKKDDADINSSNHFVPNSKTEKNSLTMFCASSCLVDDLTTEYIGHAEQFLVAKDTNHALGISEDASPADRMAICENAVHADRLGSGEHADKLDELVHSVLNLETTQITTSVSEQPFRVALISSDNGTKGGSSKVTVSFEDRDISGLSRPEETRIYEAQGDAYASKILDRFSAPKTTKVPVDVGSVSCKETGLLVENLISAKEVDIHCDRDNSRDGNPSIEGPSEVEFFIQHGHDLVVNGSFPDYSKRKVVSQILSCSSLSEV